MKILLVDDDLFLRDMYATKFTGCGYEVETADGGYSALLLLEKGNKYDLVLLDMVMPGSSGVEILKTIKEKFPDQIKRAVFLTNQGEESDVREATEAGADGYIIKADSIPSEVVEKIEVIMSEVK